MNHLKITNHLTGRRKFIAMLSAAAATGLLGSAGASAIPSETKGENTDKPSPVLPTITLGPHKISRLISGSNPILGYSYMGPIANHAMKEYFTRERVVEFHRSCKDYGITTHQLSLRKIKEDTLHQMPHPGSGTQIICLMSGIDRIEEAIEITNPIGISHHGGATDRLFAEGKSGTVRDFIKAVKDKGVLAGVSAHNPDCIKRIADEDWDVDYFMTCFYFLTRKTCGMEVPTSTLGLSSPFFKDDPKVMTGVIRQVKQPCLAFKILGAGRLCSDQETVRSAFQFAFENIKPIDGVIVGMFPWYFNQMEANSQYVRSLGQG